MAKTVCCVEMFDAKRGEYVHEEYYPRLRDAKAAADEISKENGGVAVRVVRGDRESLTTDTMNVLYHVGNEKTMKQLILTPEQHEVLGRLEAVLKEAKAQNIGFVYDLCDGGVTAYNNANSPEQYAGRDKEDEDDEEMDWDSGSIIEDISLDYYDSAMQRYYLKF